MIIFQSYVYTEGAILCVAYIKRMILQACASIYTISPGWSITLVCEHA